MEKNNLTDEYFNNHIELFGSRVFEWGSGTSFSICYEVKVDWAIAYTCDQFIIKIKEGDNTYPSLNLPRGTFLTKDNIRTATNAHAFSPDIVKLSNSEHLEFSSMEDALNSLSKKAGVTKLCSHTISVDRSTGGLILESWGKYKYQNNKCIDARIDLIDGATLLLNTDCTIDL
jgi:hypothetical protein